jgi:hypothetical protein
MYQPSGCDILVWADNTWCYRSELSEMSHMSDDYDILYIGTDEYEDFTHKEIMAELASVSIH